MGARILYVATCQPQDNERRERVRRHQAERPPPWTTVEPGASVLAVIQPEGPRADGMLLDCSTLYVSRFLTSGCSEFEIAPEVEALCAALRHVLCPAAIVTDEVGWGVVPETPLGRLFRDAAGRANQVAASQAQEVVPMVCSLPVVLKKRR